MTKEWLDGIGMLKPAPNVEHVNVYQKEAVEHLVDQLIKLNQEQNRNGTTYKDEIRIAMKAINEALKCSLITRIVCKVD